MDVLRKKSESQKSDVERRNYWLENLVSAWLTKVTELRTDAEDCNDINIGFGYQKDSSNSLLVAIRNQQ